MEVVDPARQPAVADPDLGLDRPRPVDDANDATDGGARVGDRRDRCAIAVRGERHEPKRRSAKRHDVLTAEVATDHQRRPARVERPAVDAPELGAVEALDRLARPAGRPVIGRVGRVDRADERLVDSAPRIGLDLEEVVQALVAQPFDLGFREGRVEQDLGDEVQGRFEPGGRHVDPDGQRVPAGVGVERGPEPFARLDQGDRVVALRALGQGAGRQHGRPGDAAAAPRRRRR